MVTCEELQTTLYKIESVLKNRPLTFTFENLNDSFLKPNLLLHERRLNISQKKTASILTITISA